MKKQNNRYGMRLELIEYHNDELLTSVYLVDYFELTTAERILSVNGYFSDKLKRYLEKHEIIESD